MITSFKNSICLLLLALSSPVFAQSELPASERRFGSASLPASREMRLLVDNRTTGRITVEGWDKDIIEARAVSERGDEVVIVNKEEISGIRRIFIKADYASLEDSDTKTRELGSAPMSNDSFLQVHLVVKVPRYTELDLIRVIRSNVEVSGINSPVSVSGEYSDVKLKNVGSAEIRTRSGAIEIDNAKGVAEINSTSGAIRIRNSQGAFRLVSISGPIEVRCVKGRVDVTNTEAPIDLIAVDGDVDAIATSSSVTFQGPLRGEGRYFLKSMSGRVEMFLPSAATGFSAVLTSYRGVVESDFSLANKTTMPDTHGNRRLSGRIGQGSAQIALDSFDGLVRLSKATNSPAQCK